MRVRVRDNLDSRVNSHQQGFQPHRLIYTTVDFFSAAKLTAAASADQRSALTLLLDFA